MQDITKMSLVEFAEVIGNCELQPWQRKILEASKDPNFAEKLRACVGQRTPGKSIFFTETASGPVVGLKPTFVIIDDPLKE